MSNPYKGRNMENCFTNFKVADLFDSHSRQWRESLASLLFPGEIAQKVRGLYMPLRNVKDEAVWECTKTGVFWVTSKVSVVYLEGVASNYSSQGCALEMEYLCGAWLSVM